MQCSIMIDYDYLIQHHIHIVSSNYYNYRNFTLSHIISRPFCIKPKDTFISYILLIPSILSFAITRNLSTTLTKCQSKIDAPNFPLFPLTHYNCNMEAKSYMYMYAR